MFDLVSYVSEMIGDPYNNRYSEDQIERVLDSTRMLANYVPLEGVATYGVNSAPSYLKWHTPYNIGHWESGVVLYNYAYQDITSAAVTSDLLIGVWTFSAEPNYPVYISGHTFDVNLAASKLLDELNVHETNESAENSSAPLSSFSVYGGSFSFAKPASADTSQLAQRFLERARWQDLYLLNNPHSGFVKA